MQLILIGFIVYFMVIGLIGLAVCWHHKRISYQQAILGGRSVHYVLTALSAHASDMSDWLFMAFPAALYTGGVINLWIAIGLIGGMWITWQYIAPALRKQTELLDAMTLSTYFERRFCDTSGTLRLVSALMSILFFTIYIAAGFKGFGFLAESVFQISYSTGAFIALILVIFYVFLGGYRILAWIDSFQALFLLVVILLVPCIGWWHIGGWQSIVVAGHQKQISLALLPDSWLGIVNTLIMAISWAVGYFGVPHILTKFMGIVDVREITKAKYVGLAWQIAVLAAAGLVGLIGIAYFAQPLANKELVFVCMVKDLFSPLSAGFVLSAVAGATLSVITAQILVLVSVITEDLYRSSWRKQATEKELLVVYYASIVSIACISFVISLNKAESIQQLVSYAWMGFGCAFGPLVLLSLHSRFITSAGAIASMLVGSLVAVFWKGAGQPLLRAASGLDVPAVIPGFVLSMVCAYAVSFIVKKWLHCQKSACD